MIQAEMAENLLQAARQAAERAYAPYSRFPVGAALLTEQGQIVCGVNVENVSYGLTICAERCAVFTAIAAGQTKFTAIAVWASCRAHGAITPCGACRQVLAEFMLPDASVVMRDEQTGLVKMLTLRALLPEAFGLVPDGSCQGINNS